MKFIIQIKTDPVKGSVKLSSGIWVIFSMPATCSSKSLEMKEKSLLCVGWIHIFTNVWICINHGLLSQNRLELCNT